MFQGIQSGFSTVASSRTQNSVLSASSLWLQSLHDCEQQCDVNKSLSVEVLVGSKCLLPWPFWNCWHTGRLQG